MCILTALAGPALNGVSLETSSSGRVRPQRIVGDCQRSADAAVEVPTQSAGSEIRDLPGGPEQKNSNNLTLLTLSAGHCLYYVKYIQQSSELL